MKRMLSVTRLAFAVDRLERHAVSEPVAQHLFEFRWRQRAAGHEGLVVTLRAIVGNARVRHRNFSRVKKSLAAAHLENDEADDSAYDCDEADQRASAPPRVELVVVPEVALVALGDLFLGSARRGHGASVIKQRDVCMPPGEQDEQERDRDVDEQPAMQPMLQF